MDTAFSNRCRACAVLCSEEMISLFENNLSDMFTHCTSLEISWNDSLPSRICPECFGHLTNFNKFRQNCFNSDAYFREQIVLDSIKVEPRIDVDIKFEENAAKQHFEYELLETEYVYEDFAKNDPELTALNTSAAKYICDYCNKQFSQKNHLAAHMSTHYRARLETFPCTVKACKKVFKIRKSLQNHKLQVHGWGSEPVAKAAPETVKLDCPQCPKSFDIEVKLDAHIRSDHLGLKPYKCPQCEKEFCMFRSLRRHLQSLHGPEELEKHYCTYDGCNKSYRALDTLRKHMDKIHLETVPEPKNHRKFICDEDFDSEFFATPNTVTSAEDTKAMNTEKYICDYCGKQFSQKNFISAHMATHYKQKTFPCTEGCSKVFSCRKSLKYHRLKAHGLGSQPGARSTTETVKLKLICPQCPKSFNMQVKLDAHIRSYHLGLKGYKCEQCDKEFCMSRSLRRHLRSRHNAGENERHHCPYDGCDRSYSLQGSLKKHIDLIHLGMVPKPKNEREFICDQCGRSFRCAFKLKEHTFAHAAIFSFACEVCPKKFTSSTKLKVHTRRHLKLYPCPMCDRRLSTSKALQSHINFHTKEITYPCKECPRVFSSYGAINRHVRIHHRNHKPYICPHCQRAFTKAETMKNHIMTHTGEKPFACSVCGHRFIQGVALKTHMRVHAKQL